MPVSYVPFRNAHLLSTAVSWAEVLGASAIFVGFVEEDSSGYPDCREVFLEAFEWRQTSAPGPETRISLRAPLIHLKKAEIVRRGWPWAPPWSSPGAATRAKPRPAAPAIPACCGCADSGGRAARPHPLRARAP